MSKATLIFAGFFLLLGTSVATAAGGPWGHWTQGEVTRSSWSEGTFQKVEIDGISYSFMSSAKLYRQKRAQGGIIKETSIRPENIYRSQKVNMLVQGFRIYELKVQP